MEYTNTCFVLLGRKLKACKVMRQFRIERKITLCWCFISEDKVNHALPTRRIFALYFSKNYYNGLRSYQTLEKSVSSEFQTPRLRFVFSQTLLGVWKLDEALFLVFHDMLREYLLVQLPDAHIVR